MASIFKRKRLRPVPDNAEIRTTKKGRTATWTDARGRRQFRPLNDAGDRIVVEDERYTISYHDHLGKRRTAAGTSDKDATREIANKLEGDVRLRQRGVIDARAEAIADQSTRPIGQHLADFRMMLAAGDRDEKYIHQTTKNITDIADDCGFVTANDINPDGVNRYAVGLRDRGLSLRTVQSYLIAMSTFTRWLVRTGKLPADPLVSVSKPNPRTDRRKERRMLLPDEYQWLHPVTLSGPEHHGMIGPERALLYDTGIQTGLRANELRALTRGRFRLSKRPCYVMSKAVEAKNSRDAHQYVTDELADQLKAHLKTKAPKTSVFRMPHPSCVAEMLRQDLSAAREAWLAEVTDSPQLYAERQDSDFLTATDHEGRVFDFHCLRHTCGAWLAMQGADIKTIQTIMRHHSITLTMDTYGHLLPHQEANAVKLLSGIMSADKKSAHPGIHGQQFG